VHLWQSIAVKQGVRVGRVNLTVRIVSERNGRIKYFLQRITEKAYKRILRIDKLFSRNNNIFSITEKCPFLPHFPGDIKVWLQLSSAGYLFEYICIKQRLYKGFVLRIRRQNLLQTFEQNAVAPGFVVYNTRFYFVVVCDDFVDAIDYTEKTYRLFAPVN